MPVPVEVNPFGWPQSAKQLEALGRRPDAQGKTGSGIRDRRRPLHSRLAWWTRSRTPCNSKRVSTAYPGVVENGLFVNRTSHADHRIARRRSNQTQLFRFNVFSRARFLKELPSPQPSPAKERERVSRDCTPRLGNGRVLPFRRIDHDCITQRLVPSSSLAQDGTLSRCRHGFQIPLGPPTPGHFLMTTSLLLVSLGNGQDLR